MSDVGRTNVPPPHPRDEEDSPFADAELERVMAEVPRGTFALVGATMILLLLGYFYVYLFVFLPRGMVG